MTLALFGSRWFLVNSWVKSGCDDARLMATVTARLRWFRKPPTGPWLKTTRRSICDQGAIAVLKLVTSARSARQRPGQRFGEGQAPPQRGTTGHGLRPPRDRDPLAALLGRARDVPRHAPEPPAQALRPRHAPLHIRRPSACLSSR